MQSLYGASSAFAGNTVWRWEEEERIYQTIWDSGGIDTIDWSNQTTAATIRLGQNSWSELGEPFRWRADGGGSLPGTMFISRGTLIENAMGGLGGDRIDGNALANRIEGHGGDDLLFGRDGSDALFGGDGDDRIEGGSGDDLVSGQHGMDVILGGNGDDALHGFAGDDRLYGEVGADMVSGGDGTDRLYGDLDGDLLDGGAGSDWLYGGTGDNQLNGGIGDDSLYGEDGNDLFAAWYGNDTISGGTGSDTLMIHFHSAGYRIEGTVQGGRLVDIASGDGNLGLDQFTSIEKIVFLDKTLGWSGGTWNVIG
jgi:serralysin